MFKTNSDVEVTDVKYFQSRTRDLVMFFHSGDSYIYRNMVPVSFQEDPWGNVTVMFVKGDDDA